METCDCCVGAGYIDSWDEILEEYYEEICWECQGTGEVTTDEDEVVVKYNN